jgi:Tfp pilus assembly protein PilF
VSEPSDFGTSPLVTRARELLRQDSVDAAEALVHGSLAHAPDDPEALYIKGVIANRRRDHEAAIVALRRVVAIRPDAALAWLALGTAFARSEEFVAAAEAYRAAVAREPQWADAHFNLGLVLKRQGDLPAATRALHAAWLRDPTFFDAAKQCVATIADRVRRGETSSAPALDIANAARHPVTIVLCSIDAMKHDRAVALYRRLFSHVPHEIIAVRDARSLAEAYNSAVSRSVADVVLLSHDDIDVLALDFAARIFERLKDYDALGVIGSTRMDGPAVGWSGHPHLRGWITHHAPDDATWRVDVLDPRPVAGNIIVLDGVLIAARREVLTAVPFDAETFDGFHLYDIDWSYRAARAGFRLGVAGDLLLVHASRGQYGAAWQHYADRFSAKHVAVGTPPAPSSFFGATLDSPDDVRAFYALLAQVHD